MESASASNKGASCKAKGWELDLHNTMATYVLKEALNTMSFGVWKNVIEDRINLEVRSLKA